MAAPLNTTTQEPQLHHLVVFNSIYAESEHGRFYAIRSDRYHEFPPNSHRSVVDCDAWLTVWLATR